MYRGSLQRNVFEESSDNYITTYCSLSPLLLMVFFQLNFTQSQLAVNWNVNFASSREVFTISTPYILNRIFNRNLSSLHTVVLFFTFQVSLFPFFSNLIWPKLHNACIQQYKLFLFKVHVYLITLFRSKFMTFPLFFVILYRESNRHRNEYKKKFWISLFATIFALIILCEYISLDEMKN